MTGAVSSPGGGMRAIDGMPTTTSIAPAREEHIYAPHMRVIRGEHAPLLPPVAGMSARERLRIALVIPSFQFGSGGHDVLFQVLTRLEQRGHVCTVWLEDPFGDHDQPVEEVREQVRADYANVTAPFFRGFDAWTGADIALATGWQTTFPVMRLDRCLARAYLVNDHEPEFFPTSIESRLAAATYRLGLPCLVGGSPWMARVLAERYDVQVHEVFPYGIGDAYHPRRVDRREDTIVFYGRGVTPRRAVALGMMALEHVARRRPDLRVVIFGDAAPPEASFPFEHLGLASPAQLAWLYSEATVGVAFSMTNSSLVPQDMMACGLPVVDLVGFGTESAYGDPPPVELALFDDVAVAAAIERLLDDPALRAERSRLGLAHASTRSWDTTTDHVESGIRAVLAAREEEAR